MRLFVSLALSFLHRNKCGCGEIKKEKGYDSKDRERFEYDIDIFKK